MYTTTLYYEILKVKEDFLFDLNYSGGKNYDCWVRIRDR